MQRFLRDIFPLVSFWQREWRWYFLVAVWNRSDFSKKLLYLLIQGLKSNKYIGTIYLSTFNSRNHELVKKKKINQIDCSTIESKPSSYPCNAYRKSKRIANFLLPVISPLSLQMCSSGDQLCCNSKLGKSSAFYWCCQQGGGGFWNELS